MRALRETYIDLIYIGSRKRQNLLSKLGAWEPWERAEGEGRGREGRKEKCRAQENSIKKKSQNTYTGEKAVSSKNAAEKTGYRLAVQ